MTKPSSFTDALLWALCVACAISLQTQVTLFESETYLGLRINLTDIIAPFAGIAILLTLIQKKSVWPNWGIPHFYPWLAVLTLGLTVAFLNGWILYDQISTWALVNKLLGWFILLGIMGMGGWVAANATQRQLETFLKIFLCAALVVLIHEITILVVQSFPYFQQWIPLNSYISYPIAGLMANRNAYAFLFVTVLAISTCFYFSRHDILKPTYSYILFFILPFFIIFNASRASWIAMAATVTAMLFTNRHEEKKCLKLILFAALGVMSFFIIFHGKEEQINFINHRMIEAIVSGGEETTHKGDQMRLKIIDMAWPMIQENPVFGSGLGSVMMEQNINHGGLINLIDNTPFWLLVEMGAAGLLLFSAFYIAAVKNLSKRMKDDDEFSKTIHISMLYIILAFTIMCLFHELMYTRFLWFFLGLSLALPARMRQGE